MTPQELKAIRQNLGLSAEAFAKLVRVESGRTVRRWEQEEGSPGKRDIPGPVVVIAEALRDSLSVRRYFGVAVDGIMKIKPPLPKERRPKF